MCLGVLKPEVTPSPLGMTMGKVSFGGSPKRYARLYAGSKSVIMSLACWLH
jgi:hypothetical protein